MEAKKLPKCIFGPGSGRPSASSPNRAGNCATGGNQRVGEFGPANALSDRVFPGSLRASIALCRIGRRSTNRGIAGIPYPPSKKAQTRCDSLFRAQVVTGVAFVRTLKLASPNEAEANPGSRLSVVSMGAQIIAGGSLWPENMRGLGYTVIDGERP